MDFSADYGASRRGICKPISGSRKAADDLADAARRQAEAIDAEFAEIRRTQARQDLAIKRLEDEADTLGGEIEELRKSWLTRALSKIRDFFKT